MAIPFICTHLQRLQQPLIKIVLVHKQTHKKGLTETSSWARNPTNMFCHSVNNTSSPYHSDPVFHASGDSRLCLGFKSVLEKLLSSVYSCIELCVTTTFILIFQSFTLAFYILVQNKKDVIGFLEKCVIYFDYRLQGVSKAPS